MKEDGPDLIQLFSKDDNLTVGKLLKQSMALENISSNDDDVLEEEDHLLMAENKTEFLDFCQLLRDAIPKAITMMKDTDADVAAATHRLNIVLGILRTNENTPG